ncbi:MAG: hypothetical protein M3Q45_10255 [Chloroflexota bacterium]|nr:hypothetical protein [Chloroflexota bacterium]
MQDIYPRDAQPVCEAGSSLDVVIDDGSAKFAQLHESVQNGRTVRQVAEKREV